MKIIKTKKADLENKRYLFLEIGFIITLLLVFAAFEYRDYEATERTIFATDVNTEVVELPEVTQHKKEEPKKPPVAVRNLKLTDENSDDLDDLIIDVHIDEGDQMNDLPDVKFEEEVAVSDDHPYMVVKNVVEFPGGMSALYQFLKDNLNY